MIRQQALRSQGAYGKGGDVWWLLVSFKERFIDTIQRKLLVWLIVGEEQSEASSSRHRG
jgi:hypothetical protein